MRRESHPHTRALKPKVLRSHFGLEGENMQKIVFTKNLAQFLLEIEKPLILFQHVLSSFERNTPIKENRLHKKLPTPLNENCKLHYALLRLAQKKKKKRQKPFTLK